MDWVKSAFLSQTQSKSYDETNGLIFNDIALPEEIILHILTYTDVKSILSCMLVCKKWNDLIKSVHFWRLYQNIHTAKNKNLPWYVYYCYACKNSFDVNFLKNGNGQKMFQYWKNVEHRGDGWIVENPPGGADTLPENIPDFNGKSSCFATSFYSCKKRQIISLKNKKLLRRILNEFQPTIYASEWFAGRFDCGCTYKLAIRLYDENKKLLFEKEELRTVLQWAGSAWEKVEIICENYGQNVCFIEFYHEGCDTQFWKGHYGSKMAGGVIKVLFNSI